MALETSFRMPWLNTEPPTAALARGAAVGAQIGAARRQAAALRQDAEQFVQLQAVRERELAIREQEEKERVQTASRQFAAQQAYQAAVTRDLSALEQQGNLTDEEALKVAAKHYLRYGATMGPGFGGALGGIMRQTPQAQAPVQVPEGMVPDSITVGPRGPSTTYKTKEEPFSPEARQITDPVTGKPITVIRTGPNAWREPRGEGEEISFTNDKGESFTIKRGGKSSGAAGQMPAATVTRANESLLGARSANAIGRELIPLLTPMTIGPGGLAKRVVVTKGLANLLPSLKAGAEIDVQSLATAYRADVQRALRVDQMAEAERKEINAALPQDKAIFESPQSATRSIQNFNRMVASRARLAAQQAGLAIPPDLMTPTELRDAVRAGKLDRATAEQLALESPFAEEMNR